MPSYAITGVSRGIGFELMQKLSADPSNVVFGLVRGVEAVQEKVSKAWPERKNIHIIHGELTDAASLKSAAKYVSTTTGGSLDMLIANAALAAIGFAGVDDEVTKDPAAFDKLMHESFDINVIGNIHLLNAFTPLIKKGELKKVIVLSSAMGDAEFVADVGVKAQTPYAASKAALNMVVAKYHVQYAEEGILFMALSPGLVETGNYDKLEKTPEFFAGMAEFGRLMTKYAGPDFKGPAAPEECVKAVLDVIDKATIEKNGGKMVSHLGNTTWL